jgi:hypothetical protein
MQSFYAAELFLSSPFLLAEHGRVKPVNIQQGHLFCARSFTMPR